MEDGIIFKVGDLVMYAPYFGGDEGLLMKGDLGIVIQVRYTDGCDRWQVVRVKWANGEMGDVDMASQILKKIPLDNPDRM